MGKNDKYIARVRGQIENGSRFVFLREQTVSHDYLACNQDDVSAALKKYKEEHGYTIREIAFEVGKNESYMAKLLYASQGTPMVGLDVIDPIFTTLGIEIPRLYIRAWVPLEE